MDEKYKEREGASTSNIYKNESYREGNKWIVTLLNDMTNEVQRNM